MFPEHRHSLRWQALFVAFALIVLSSASGAAASSRESAVTESPSRLYLPSNGAPLNPGGTDLVISQVYSGGGQTGATYRNDYVELFNPTLASISVGGMSLQITVGGSGTNWVLTPLAGTVPPGGYYLIRLASSGANGLVLPTPDLSNTSSTNLSVGAAKIALVSSTALLTCGADHAANSCQGNSSVVDFVGYGSNASDYEGSGRAPASGPTVAVTRNGGGCGDTDDNAADFTAQPPNPRNTASQPNPCAAPVTSTPTSTSTQTATPTNTFTPTSTSTPTRTNTRTNTPTNTPTSTPTGTCPGAFHFFQPQAGAPANGGTVTVGDRFVLDLIVNPGPYAAAAQQAYLTFTHELLRNAAVSTLSAGCAFTSTLTGDYAVFDALLQDEVCNGPEPCLFRGELIAPGNVAFASGALSNMPYSGTPFRVARVGLCAVAPGTAVLHWQFSPPGPVERDTEILDENVNIVSDRACYQDQGNYIIHILAATPTRTSTPTPTSTATYTPTTEGTPTATGTPTSTPSPETFTFSAEADAYVDEAQPSTNFGASTVLSMDSGAGVTQQSFLRFSVSGISGPILEAKVRIFATNGSTNGPAIYGTSNSWSETAITWNNRPSPAGTPSDNKAAIPSNSYTDYNVTPPVGGNGTYSFVLVPESSDGVDAYSREGASPPQLVITAGGGAPNTSTPSPTATPTSTASATATATAPATATPTATTTDTLTPTPTNTGVVPTTSPTTTPTPTGTQQAAGSTQTATPTSTQIATHTPTPAPTASPTDTQTATRTVTATATATSTPTPTATLTTTSTRTPTITPTATITPDPNAPDLLLSITPTVQTLIRPGTIAYTITLTSVNGFAGSVDIALSGLPNKVSGAFSPNPVVLSPGGTATSVLTLTAQSSGSTGTFPLAITATGGALVRTENVTLIVRR